MKKNKFTWVLFIGPPAVGKLTIAKIISKKTGYHLVHNHLLIDFLKNIIPESIYTDRKIYRYKLYFDLLEIFSKNKISLVMTLAYAQDYFTEDGLSFPDLIQKIENIAHSNNGELVVIHLTAGLKTLLSRVTSMSRRNFGKIKNKNLLKKVYESNDFQTTPDNIKNVFKIETDNKNKEDVFIEVLNFLI